MPKVNQLIKSNQDRDSPQLHVMKYFRSPFVPSAVKLTAFDQNKNITAADKLCGGQGS